MSMSRYHSISVHVISHWDDGSGMTAVWINSNLTWVTSSSPNKIAWPGGGRKVESQMIGWGPKNGSGTLLPVGEKNEKKC